MLRKIEDFMTVKKLAKKQQNSIKGGTGNGIIATDLTMT